MICSLESENMRNSELINRINSKTTKWEYVNGRTHLHSTCVLIFLLIKHGTFISDPPNIFIWNEYRTQVS